MVTRIKSVTVGKLGRIAGQRTTPKSDAGSAATVSSASRGDDVVFSSDARLIGRADEVVGQAPDIRMELVGPIREAVMAGRYNVSSLDVADKILRQVLLDRKKSV
ncbi:MAG: flagellar biosynthesis anti-sigma factor FlgM [Magnetococcus sp. DMHC-8]